MRCSVSVKFSHSTAAVGADEPVTSSPKVRAAFSECNRCLYPIVPPVCDGGGDKRVKYIGKELIGVEGFEARLLLEICGVDGGV